MSTIEIGGLEKQSKSKGTGSQKGKGKEVANVDYDATRFMGKI